MIGLLTTLFSCIFSVSMAVKDCKKTHGISEKRAVELVMRPQGCQPKHKVRRLE